jgi:hypothetical protein
MKRISLVLITSFFCIVAASQNIVIPLQYTFQEPPSGGTAHNIPFQISGNPNNTQYRISITASPSSTAVPTTDFILGPVSPNPVTSNGVISITVYNNATRNPTLRRLDLRIIGAPVTNVGAILDTTININIQDYGALPLALRQDADTTHVSLSLLTAASFDFYGQSAFGKYAGNVNVHMPAIWNRIGLNFGISHLNYYTADTSSGRIYTSNVLLNPAENKLTDTSKFKVATFALNSKTEFKSWSYYAQLLYYSGSEEKPPKDAIARFYYTMHFEAFTQQSKTTFKVDSIFNSVETYTSTRDNRKVFAATNGVRPKEIVRKQTDGFFGVGGTLCLNYPNRFNVFSQAIFGITTANPRFLETYVPDTSPQIVRAYQITKKDDPGSFYIFKGQIMEKFTKLNGTIGVEIRGLFPTYDPLIAAYLGFQLKFEDFFKKG